LIFVTILFVGQKQINVLARKSGVFFGLSTVNLQQDLTKLAVCAKLFSTTDLFKSNKTLTARLSRSRKDQWKVINAWVLRIKPQNNHRSFLYTL